ncbi:SAVMC3_10250 family protein [Streptomyces antimycoticus]|uniref:SAVMC3_10250 family protein n=1 Tax=Streptomyces antimycoticus TaxID=68175 RepID=UPI001180F8A9|nr:SAVMC3_10250 family protein [Streptomyces antimycoticus]
MTEIVFLSEQKLYGRLGIRRTTSQTSASGTLKIPPVIDISASRSRSEDPLGKATIDDLAIGVKKVDELHDPAEFTDLHLQANRWIRFDLHLAQNVVYEDSGYPPADVALFAGDVPAGEAGQPRDMGFLLCGSIQHLRTRDLPPGRMGSDTTWLHDLILELDRREREGGHVIPEFLTEVVPVRGGERMREQAAFGVHGWMSRDWPMSERPRMRGYAIVLMDIDNPHWTHRLVVASPLFVEVTPQRTNPRRRFGFAARRRTRARLGTPLL